MKTLSWAIILSVSIVTMQWAENTDPERASKYADAAGGIILFLFACFVICALGESK